MPYSAANSVSSVDFGSGNLDTGRRFDSESSEFPVAGSSKMPKRQSVSLGSGSRLHSGSDLLSETVSKKFKTESMDFDDDFDDDFEMCLTAASTSRNSFSNAGNKPSTDRLPISNVKIRQDIQSAPDRASQEKPGRSVANEPANETKLPSRVKVESQSAFDDDDDDLVEMWKVPVIQHHHQSSEKVSGIVQQKTFPSSSSNIVKLECVEQTTNSSYSALQKSTTAASSIINNRASFVKVEPDCSSPSLSTTSSCRSSTNSIANHHVKRNPDDVRYSETTNISAANGDQKSCTAGMYEYYVIVVSNYAANCI